MSDDSDAMAPEADDRRRVVFSSPELDEIARTLKNTFGGSIENDESFEVAAALNDGFIEMVIVLANYDRTSVCRLQGATEPEEDNLDSFLDARADLVEFLGAMLEEYLESSRLTALHIDWKEYDYQGRVIHFRSSLENEKLRAMADELLGEGEDDVN